MRKTGRTSSFATILTLLCTSAAAQQDTIAVGHGICATASTRSSVTVPIFVRDAPGTILGNDQPLPGHSHGRIQAIAFQLTINPPDAVRSKLIERAGILLGHQPISELTRQTSDSVSYFAVFDDQRDPLTFSPGSVAGDLVANLVLDLTPGASGRLTVSVNPSPRVTLLSDQRGEFTEDTTTELRVSNGCVDISTGGRRRAVRR